MTQVSFTYLLFVCMFVLFPSLARAYFIIDLGAAEKARK
jgi:hypothetical protein